MRNLSVYQRLAMIIAVMTFAFLAVAALQIVVLRNTVLSERQTIARNIVQAASKIMAFYDAEAKAGKISSVQARQMAYEAIGAMRWGKSSDYVGVYGATEKDAGVTYVHANKKYINVNRWNFKDGKGQLLIQDIVKTARAGGGFVEYFVPRSGGGEELRKLAYVEPFGAAADRIAIQAGVYVDDINAVVKRYLGRHTWSRGTRHRLCGCILARARIGEAVGEHL